MVDGVAKLVFVSAVAETDDSAAPTYEALCFHLTYLHLFYWETAFLNLAGCWLSSISPFATFARSINDFTISFEAFSLFMIPFRRGIIHWELAVFIVLSIHCLAGLCCVFTVNFISKKVKIESGKTPLGQKSPRWKVFENNFCFDDCTVP